jgi:N-acetyl sugar amidotransferase
MDTSDKSISFDQSGVCNHCHHYNKQIDSLPKEGESKVYLDSLIQRLKKQGKGKQYDCVIGLSGGVDSTYVAYLVKRKFGLRPLAVHLDNGWNSELSVKNIENIVKILDIDLYTHVIDWEEFKDIQLSFLKASTPDSEIPTDHAIFCVLRQISKKYSIKSVINGINLRTEGHHPLSWSQGHNDFGYIKSVQKRFGTKNIKTLPHGNFFTIIEDRFSSNWINILNFVDYNKEEAKKIISRELAWKDYGGKHFESIYTRFYQGYILPKKFGIDKRRMHFSSLICAGEMSRDEALILLKEEPYNVDMQKADLDYVLKKFEISLQEFEAIMNLPAKNYYDYPSYYGQLLKSQFVKKVIKLVKPLLK